MNGNDSLLNAVKRAAQRGRLAPATRQLIKDDVVGRFRDIARTVARDHDDEPPSSLVVPPFDIDAVFTWVDHTDPRWQADLRRALDALRAGGVIDPLSHHDARYEDHDELRYSLRSLWQYANWFRRVIVVSAGQRPSWLSEHERVQLVSHDQLLPPSALPTFNSHAIEAALHRIDGLSEHFVYLNDDFFFARPVAPQVFFEITTGRPRVFTSDAPIPPNARTSTGQYAAASRTEALISDLTGRPAPRLLDHAPYALEVSTLRDLESRLSGEFERTAHHRFRHVDDVSVPASLAPWYALNSGRAVGATASAEYVSVGHPTTGARLRRLRRYRRVDTFCLNWTEVSNPRWDAAVRAFLAERFPLPAPWEEQA